MDRNLIIMINRPGVMEGPKGYKDLDKQVVKDPLTNKTRVIYHTDRKNTMCTKQTVIQSSVVDQWMKGVTPGNINIRTWSKMTPDQKLQAHILSFDEGYGVSYSFT